MSPVKQFLPKVTIVGGDCVAAKFTNELLKLVFGCYNERASFVDVFDAEIEKTRPEIGIALIAGASDREREYMVRGDVKVCVANFDESGICGFPIVRKGCMNFL